MTSLTFLVKIRLYRPPAVAWAVSLVCAKFCGRPQQRWRHDPCGVAVVSLECTAGFSSDTEPQGGSFVAANVILSLQNWVRFLPPQTSTFQVEHFAAATLQLWQQSSMARGRADTPRTIYWRKTTSSMKLFLKPLFGYSVTMLPININVWFLLVVMDFWVQKLWPLGDTDRGYQESIGPNWPLDSVVRQRDKTCSWNRSRHTLTSPSDRILCLMRIAHARCLSDPTHCSMVTSNSVSHTTVPGGWIGALCLTVDSVLISWWMALTSKS